MKVAVLNIAAFSLSGSQNPKARSKLLQSPFPEKTPTRTRISPAIKDLMRKAVEEQKKRKRRNSLDSSRVREEGRIKNDG